ncbi:MAG TPA: S9 family peptidase [Solirubrobacteraceae bacterium]
MIARSVLFDNPQREAPALSPDGRRIAYLAPSGGISNIWVGDLDSTRARPLTRESRRSIMGHAWAHDGRHLLYVQDRDGDENWHLHAVDVQTGEDRDLTPFDGVQARLLGLEPAVPGEALVGLNRDDPELHDAYRIRIATGEIELAEKNPGFSWFPSWVVDHQLRPRGGIHPRADGGLEIWVRDAGPGTWRTILVADADDAFATSAFGFSDDGRELFAVCTFGEDTARLHRLNLNDGSAREIAGHPSFDISGVRIDPHTHEPQLATVDGERLRYLVVDRALEPDLAAHGELGRGDPHLTSRDDADQRWIVRLNADDRPPVYHLYDRRSRKPELLFQTRPALSRYRLARMEPFSFRARDGLLVHGYVTFPTFGRARWPAVVSVHGGPYGRDRWGFDPEVQWLANRGYLCIQVNFRGSTGYGRRFLAAGDREWGAKMQDDLVDAVAWAIDEGHADGARIGISGASYGGYAALAAAAFTPDVFRCAISLAGPTNLVTLIERTPPYWAGLAPQLRRRIGDPRHDAELLWARSPLAHAADIRIPVLLAHGAHDPRVSVAESEALVEAMTQSGVPHTYLRFDDEGHSLVGEHSQLRFIAAAEQFLAEHLGGRQERS